MIAVKAKQKNKKCLLILKSKSSLDFFSKVQLFSKQFSVGGRFLFVWNACLCYQEPKYTLSLLFCPTKMLGALILSPKTTFCFPSSPWNWVAWWPIGIASSGVDFPSNYFKRGIKGSFCFSEVYPLRATEREHSLPGLGRKAELKSLTLMKDQ